MIKPLNAKQHKNKVTIKSYIEAKIRVSVRSDGLLTLTIDDEFGRSRFTGDFYEVGGFIIGYMAPDVNEE